MFDFMQTACLASCGWADKKGCVGEHPRGEEWTRAGICNTHPFFMAHTCRESCGVCGFLSPFNNEDQVVDGDSYTEYKNDNFKCGEYKLLCEINDEDCEGKRFRTPEDEATVEDEANQNDVDDDIGDFIDLRDSDTAAFSFNIDDPTQYFCGATIVSDRFIVAAAHCHDDFGEAASGKPIEVKVNTIRSVEGIFLLRTVTLF